MTEKRKIDLRLMANWGGVITGLLTLIGSFTFFTSAVQKNTTKIEQIEIKQKILPKIIEIEKDVESLEEYRSESEPTRIEAIEQLARTNQILIQVKERLDKQEKKIDIIIDKL